MRPNLRTSYLVLAGLIVLVSAIYLWTTLSLLQDTTAFNSGFLQAARDVSLNLTTNLVSSFILLFLIDRVISRNEDSEVRQRRALAISQLRAPLHAHLQFLAIMANAPVSDGSSASDATGVRELTDPIFFERLSKLDLVSAAPTKYPARNWASYAWLNYMQLGNSISRIIERYSIWLEADAVSLLQDLANSPLSAFFNHEESMIRTNKNATLTGLLALEPFRSALQQHLSLTQAALDLYNQSVDHGRRLEVKLEIETKAAPNP